MIKLIASDIDGTLLRGGAEEISAVFFEQANRLMDQGVAVCAASGRQYKSLRRLFAPAADRMYFICENGAVVFGPGDPPRLISRTEIDRATALKLCHDILNVPECELLISGTNTSYLCPKTEEFVTLIRYFVGNNLAILPNPEAMPEDFVKISAYYRAGADRIEPILRPQWEGTFQVAIAGQPWLDFTIADKSTGILALCRDLGISPEDAAAFGDNYNDIPMLRTVGHPWLVDTAAEALRRMFPIQCTSVEDILAQL